MPGGTNGPPVLNGARFVFPRKTLGQLRTKLVKRTGFSAMLATLPPGLQLLMDDFLQSAHDHIYLRYPQFRMRYWWKIDITQGNRFYDIPYEGAYTGELTDVSFADAGPDTITRAAGSFVTDGFTDGMKIRIQGSELNDKIVTAATVTATVITLAATDELSTEAAGEPVIISEASFQHMETSRIHQAWLLDDTQWNPMTQGISPGRFNTTNQLIPDSFDIRQFVEVWPEPDKAYELYIDADIALRAFEYDTDYSSVDPHLLFTLALGKAKFHYGQHDYRDYYGEFNALVGKHNAGTFGAQRYIPCPKERPEYPEKYPGVTFPRP